MSEQEREASKEKRKGNREWSTNLLQTRGVPFVSKNLGAHLIVAERFDFWPGTGLFIERKTGKKGRGVHKLLRELNHG